MRKTLLCLASVYSALGCLHLAPGARGAVGNDGTAPTARVENAALPGIGDAAGGSAAIVEDAAPPGTDLRSGDRLTGWRRESASPATPAAEGAIDSPFA